MEISKALHKMQEITKVFKQLEGLVNTNYAEVKFALGVKLIILEGLIDQSFEKALSCLEEDEKMVVHSSSKKEQWIIFFHKEA